MPHIWKTGPMLGMCMCTHAERNPWRLCVCEFFPLVTIFPSHNRKNSTSGASHTSSFHTKHFNRLFRWFSHVLTTAPNPSPFGNYPACPHERPKRERGSAFFYCLCVIGLDLIGGVQLQRCEINCRRWSASHGAAFVSSLPASCWGCQH